MQKGSSPTPPPPKTFIGGPVCYRSFPCLMRVVRTRNLSAAGRSLLQKFSWPDAEAGEKSRKGQKQEKGGALQKPRRSGILFAGGRRVFGIVCSGPLRISPGISPDISPDISPGISPDISSGSRLPSLTSKRYAAKTSCRKPY